MLPPPRPLRDLAPLNRALLHVFVAGPGRGEAIAVALPERGWLLIDSCTAATGQPATLAILNRWRMRDDDPVVLAILSHPHDDHADGFAELLNATDPLSIGVAGATGAPRYVDILRDAPLPVPTELRTRANAVRSALAAIRSWELRHGAARALCAQADALLKTNSVEVHVLGPEADALSAYLHECKKTPSYIRSDANQYSILVEVRFGQSSIVLPGDLPRTVGGAVVATGWDPVLKRLPHLCKHTGLKVPHHGSAEATHADLMSPGPDGSRAWAITPYNSSRLPRVADMDGLPYIVARNGSAQLTGVPASKQLQSSVPQSGQMPLNQLASRVASQPTGSKFIDSAGIEVTPGDAIEPLDAVWCFAFDHNDVVTGRWRGTAALEVVS